MIAVQHTTSHLSKHKTSVIEKNYTFHTCRKKYTLFTVVKNHTFHNCRKGTCFTAVENLVLAFRKKYFLVHILDTSYKT